MDSLSMAHQRLGDKAMTGSSSYAIWNNFFLLAGIPNAVANEYAITFSQHRIQIDMLKEITKEILLDMGIKAMGDIIAILRHAKNLCTQDELKSGPKAATSRFGDHHIMDPRQAIANHISQRTPISTSRTGIQSLVGGKIQNRIGEVSAIPSKSYVALASQSATNKRSSTSISTTLAKRLRPAPNNDGRDSRALTEKTLTVHYPSSSAIARAQQRISSKANTPIKSSDIKSRLGTVPTVANNDRSARINSNAANSRDRADSSRGNRSSSSSSNRNSTSNQTNTTRRNDGNQKTATNQSNRPKSTVFKRLGETAR